VRRIESGSISALKFGDEPPEVVFLARRRAERAYLGHGDPPAWALPALAVDLPGHGRSGMGARTVNYGPKLKRRGRCGPVLREWAPNPRLVVGMSLGGLTALRIAANRGEAWCPNSWLVDVTPSRAPKRHEQNGPRLSSAPSHLLQGRAHLPVISLAMLDVTIAAAPQPRPEIVAPRCLPTILSNSTTAPWTWRYELVPARATGFRGAVGMTCRRSPWPTTLVRGANSFFVKRRGRPGVRERGARLFSAPTSSADSGHSVQGRPAASTRRHSARSTGRLGAHRRLGQWQTFRLSIQRCRRCRVVLASARSGATGSWATSRWPLTCRATTTPPGLNEYADTVVQGDR